MTQSIPVCIGVGCQRGTALSTLEDAVDAILAELGPVEVRCIVSHQRKAEEPALLALARKRGWVLQCFPSEQLAAVAVPNPCARVGVEVGTPSVAEAAALLAAGSSELLVEKRRHVGADGKGATLAVARCR
ncbi:cobalamin biosynthesis protein [Thiorhodococcus mannitoliphagus]|uniref:Cobalamin biosynthesis protein n=1 Tax=Thiorhodococcus mannitoliphagus TaxID=329406 RepID=A0A6P1DVA0_9GAMM|nr:cobalamin biosynthesis protein [Thiorhodococcus mannitoliphagus]NEX19982.1 cobalamin biosynthesis protein [Thiorhodococcus mannitoliphagus]